MSRIVQFISGIFSDRGSKEDPDRTTGPEPVRTVFSPALDAGQRLLGAGKGEDPEQVLLARLVPALAAICTSGRDDPAVRTRLKLYAGRRCFYFDSATAGDGRPWTEPVSETYDRFISTSAPSADDVIELAGELISRTTDPDGVLLFIFDSVLEIIDPRSPAETITARDLYIRLGGSVRSWPKALKKARKNRKAAAKSR